MMVTNEELRTKLIILLLTESGPSRPQLTHRSGRVREIVYALTGEDIGYAESVNEIVEETCKAVGWKFKKILNVGITISGFENQVDREEVEIHCPSVSWEQR